MKRTLILLMAVGLVGCGRGSSRLTRDQQQYEVVQEGSASGVTSTINAPGETTPPITGTNADTTTAFTLPMGGVASPNGQPGTIAGTLPMDPSGAMVYPGQPPQPVPQRPRPVAQQPVQVRQEPATQQTQAPPMTSAQPEPSQQQQPQPQPSTQPPPPPETTTQAPPPQPETNTAPPPEKKKDQKKNDDDQQQEQQQPPSDEQPAPPPPTQTDTFGPGGMR